MSRHAVYTVYHRDIASVKRGLPFWNRTCRYAVRAILAKCQQRGSKYVRRAGAEALRVVVAERSQRRHHANLAVTGVVIAHLTNVQLVGLRAADPQHHLVRDLRERRAAARRSGPPRPSR